MKTPRTEAEMTDTILRFGELVSLLAVNRARAKMPWWARWAVGSANQRWVARLGAAVAVKEMAETDPVGTGLSVINTVERLEREIS